MLTEKEQKHYQPITLNRIFAVTSLLFMGSLIWMFADDYERSWKRYQKQFRQLESKKVEMTYNSQNYDEWLMWTEEERVRLRAEEDRKAAENNLKKAKDEHFKVDQSFKFGKAKYDELTYRYKEAQAGHKGNPVDALNLFTILLNWKRSLLNQRIIQRTQEMLDKGWIEEVDTLLNKQIVNGSFFPALNSIGYRQIQAYLNGCLLYTSPSPRDRG